MIINVYLVKVYVVEISTEIVIIAIHAHLNKFVSFLFVYSMYVFVVKLFHSFSV